LQKNDFMSFYLEVIDMLQGGEFKPNIQEKEHICFKKFIKNAFLKVAYHYKITREFNLHEHSKEVSVIPEFVNAQSNAVFF